jgi:hypothetical protein
MEKKKIITIIIILITILIVISIIIQRNQLSQLSLDTEDNVCLYLSNIPPYNCKNYKCNIKNEGIIYWDVFYMCPNKGPIGQGYSLSVSKITKKIKVIGLTN